MADNMYQTLACEELATRERQSNSPSQGGVFSITRDGSKMEGLDSRKTSRRTILVCSFILVSVTGILCTWLFVAKPHFYPEAKIGERLLFGREVSLKLSVGEKSTEDSASAKISAVKSRSRRDISGGSVGDLGTFVGNHGDYGESTAGGAHHHRERRDTSHEIIRRSIPEMRLASRETRRVDNVEIKREIDDVGPVLFTGNMPNKNANPVETGVKLASPGAGRSKVENVTHDHKVKIEMILDEKKFPINDSRLPFSIIPEEYYITLDIDMQKDNFTGHVRIVTSCDQRTDKIIIHARRLNVFDANVTTERKLVKMRKVSYIKKWEMLILEMDGELEEGKKYDINILYDVTYSSSLSGLYKSQYRKNGEEKTVVSTHFEPTDARSVFPCLDEPYFKARFHITLLHDKRFTALSNMPVSKTTELKDGRAETQFQVSVRMSTYLVAVSVNDFKFKETVLANGVKVRTYAPESDYNRIQYATDAGAKIISFYEEFFGAKYPLPKSDLLAVPDFLAGAMEDWGLISFRSAYLIYDPKLMTSESMRQVTLVIAHELAHQWFGNLVTMKWWNDIWLNEGFANYVEMYGTNEVNPEFRALDMQVPTGWQAAITMDSMKNSHAVSQDVNKPSEIDELFDAISYNKGASLLRMVNGFMGKAFIDGVKTYIQEYKFSNAETDDLWRHLSKALLDQFEFQSVNEKAVTDHITNKTNEVLDIKLIMDTWTRQAGYPLLTVTRVNDTTITVSQESFHSVKERVIEHARNGTAFYTKNATSAGMNATVNTSPAAYLVTNLQNPQNPQNPQNSSSLLDSSSSSPPFNNATKRSEVEADAEAAKEQEKKADAIWYVPFTYVTNEKPDEESLVWIKKTKEVNITVPKDFLWIKGNMESKGFYMINYDNRTWYNLIKQLRENHTVFSEVNRAGIIHDAFKLACEGVLNPTITLELSKYLSKEKAFIPWAMVRAKYDCLSSMTHNHTQKMHYKKYFWHIQSHLVDISMLDSANSTQVELDAKNLTLFDKFQRFDTFSSALKNNFRKDFRAKLREIFLRMKNKEDISHVIPEVRALALMYGYDTKDESDWNFLWQLYGESEVDSDRKLIMKAFAHFTDHEKVKTILEKSLDKNVMRVQDTIPLLANIVRVNARKQVWDFIVGKYDQFKERYGGGYQFGQLFTEVAGGFNSPHQLKEVREFLKKHPIGHKNSRTELQIVEKIESNIQRHSSHESMNNCQIVSAWIERELNKITVKRQL